jgi:hypothetical protein
VSFEANFDNKDDSDHDEGNDNEEITDCLDDFLEMAFFGGDGNKIGGATNVRVNSFELKVNLPVLVTTASICPCLTIDEE